MGTALFTVMAVLGIVYIAATSITDDKRVYDSLTKKQLRNLSIIKDVTAAIIIILLVVLPFIG